MVDIKKNNIFKKIRFENDNLNNYKMIDIIFFSFCVFFMPFIWIIIRYFLWPNYRTEMLNFANNQSYILDKSILNIYTISVSLFQFIFPLIGITYLFFKDRDWFINKKIWFLYFFFLVTPLLNVIVSSINNEITSFVINTLLVIVLLIWFLYKDALFRKKIKLFFLKDKVFSYITILVISLLIYFLINYIFALLTSLMTRNNSFNQLILESELSSSLGKANIFFSAIIIAPILEELTFRRFFIDIEVLRFKTNKFSKLLIYLISCFSFSMFHVIQGGDIEYLIAYSSMPIITSLVYFNIRNELPCIIIHMISNLISYIILIS